MSAPWFDKYVKNREPQKTKRLQTKRSMELEEVFHMNGGDGELSYSKNSLVQRKIMENVDPILVESLTNVYCQLLPECLKVADLGCSCGPNTLVLVSRVMKVINTLCQSLNRKAPALQMFLNDLPGNDFNSIFKSLKSFFAELKKENNDDFGHCFVVGVPGSFYTRIFPDNSLHFVHSSCSMHWLSQAPKGLVSEEGEAILNKGSICLSNSSGYEVHEAYLQQFERDFSLFLTLRAQEIVPNGGMLITITGCHRSEDPESIFEPFSLAFQDMVSDGTIEEKKLDMFNMAYYTPTVAEIEMMIQAEGSFNIQKLETFEMLWDINLSEHYDVSARAGFIATYVRAVMEPIFSNHFGENVMDDLFYRYKKKVIDFITLKKCEFLNLVICLTKKA